MNREIVATVRRERSTLLRLSCGHERSIGGHVTASGRPVADWQRFRIGYDCQDGHCGGRA